LWTRLIDLVGGLPNPVEGVALAGSTVRKLSRGKARGPRERAPAARSNRDAARAMHDGKLSSISLPRGAVRFAVSTRSCQ
jgi:hypothetical protein